MLGRNSLLKSWLRWSIWSTPHTVRADQRHHNGRRILTACYAVQSLHKLVHLHDRAAVLANCLSVYIHCQLGPPEQRQLTALGLHYVRLSKFVGYFCEWGGTLQPSCHDLLLKIILEFIVYKWNSMKEATQLIKSMPAEMEVERESLRGKSVKLTEGMVLAKARSSDLENVKKLNCW